MKKLRSRSGKKWTEEISLSPLIDIIFILLIFFIVTSVFTKESAVKIQKPKALSAIEMDKQAISISITADQKVLSNGLEIPLNGLRSYVKHKLKKEVRPVLILVDKSISVDFYTKVHDQVALAGADSISMAAVSESL